MIPLRKWLRLLALVWLAHALAACGSPAPKQGPVVLAASSLQESLTEVAQAWTAQGHPAPVLSFAASSALARQIQQGAPADLFLSADEDWADTLEKAKLLRPGTRADLLSNRLVLIAPKDGKVRSLAGLGQGKLALADPSAVPAGKYAKAALTSLGQWQTVEAKVVPAENVRAALALVEHREAALGIVYETDALASGKVAVVDTLPENSHPPIRYPVAVLAGSSNPDGAAFRAFLASGTAGAIFQRHGFGLAK